MHEFDKDNVLKVAIDEVRPNGYNPKLKDTDEYKKIVESIKINGFKQPILVREIDDGYVICDGEQRWSACKELGLTEIYVYNLGEISEEKAKALTIWMEQNVAFDELRLAPLVVELGDLEMEIPYSKTEIEDFANMLEFDFAPKEKMEDGLEDLIIKMTGEQLKVVGEALDRYAKDNNVSRGEALDKLTEEGIKYYGL